MFLHNDLLRLFSAHFTLFENIPVQIGSAFQRRLDPERLNDPMPGGFAYHEVAWAYPSSSNSWRSNFTNVKSLPVRIVRSQVRWGIRDQQTSTNIRNAINIFAGQRWEFRSRRVTQVHLRTCSYGRSWQVLKSPTPNDCRVVEMTFVWWVPNDLVFVIYQLLYQGRIKIE